MSGSMPTTAYLRESYAREKHPDLPDLIQLRREGFDRWLDRYTAEKRAEWEAEQGGRRWFTPAYQSTSGNIIAFGDETVVQEHAQRYADRFTREDPEGPDYFVATRISPPWMPVPDTTGAES